MATGRSRGLAFRLVIGTLLPAVLTLGAFGVLAHEVARRTLEDELGRRLSTAAMGVAATVFPGQMGVVDPESESHKHALERLRRERDRLGVRRVLLVARDLTARGDSEGRVALGARAHELGADQPELTRAAAGEPAWSVLFEGDDGALYGRGYARIGRRGVPAGFVAVEGSAATYASLASFRRYLVGGGLAALAVIVLITTLIARRITRPLERLADAATRIGQGDLRTGVAGGAGHDEIGVLARTLDEMRTALAARDERMQMMLAGIAHEVRNPLGGLKLFAGLLRDALPDQPDRLAEVARIEREIGHLEAVVNDFLDYARRPAPTLERVPIRSLLDEVSELCRAAAPAIAWTVEAPDDAAVQADRNQLRRALLNLARNAGAAARKTVSLGARRDGHDVVIDIRDDGPGIPADRRAHIFEPFFTTREKGTGLGLAFVHDIAGDHGGTIDALDAPEGGAWFRLRLPA